MVKPRYCVTFYETIPGWMPVYNQRRGFTYEISFIPTDSLIIDYKSDSYRVWNYTWGEDPDS